MSEFGGGFNRSAKIPIAAIDGVVPGKDTVPIQEYRKEFAGNYESDLRKNGII